MKISIALAFVVVFGVSSTAMAGTFNKAAAEACNASGGSWQVSELTSPKNGNVFHCKCPGKFNMVEECGSGADKCLAACPNCNVPPPVRRVLPRKPLVLGDTPACTITPSQDISVDPGQSAQFTVDCEPLTSPADWPTTLDVTVSDDGKIRESRENAKKHLARPIPQKTRTVHEVFTVESIGSKKGSSVPLATVVTPVVKFRKGRTAVITPVRVTWKTAEPPPPPHCGNMICEPPLGENPTTCPADCPPEPVPPPPPPKIVLPTICEISGGTPYLDKDKVARCDCRALGSDYLERQSSKGVWMCVPRPPKDGRSLGDHISFDFRLWLDIEDRRVLDRGRGFAGLATMTAILGLDDEGKWYIYGGGGGGGPGALVRDTNGKLVKPYQYNVNTLFLAGIRRMFTTNVGMSVDGFYEGIGYSNSIHPTRALIGASIGLDGKLPINKWVSLVGTLPLKVHRHFESNDPQTWGLGLAPSIGLEFFNQPEPKK